MTADPSAVACHVRGLATSFAAYTTRPCGPRHLSAPHASQHVKRAGAPMGFTLHGVPLDRDGCSSRSPCPLAVAASCRPATRRCGALAGSRLQGLVPAASPFSTGASRGKPPSAPAADPVLRFRSSPERAPARPGPRFGRGASPRTLGWGDVPIHPGLRVSGSSESGGPSPDPQLS